MVCIYVTIGTRYFGCLRKPNGLYGQFKILKRIIDEKVFLLFIALGAFAFAGEGESMIKGLLPGWVAWPGG